jgi:hypothetical protein
MIDKTVSKKKTMKNLTQNQTSKTSLLNPPKQVNKAQTWDVLLDGEIIGTVHGQTREQAQDTINIWKMKGLTIAPTTYKGN